MSLQLQKPLNIPNLDKPSLFDVESTIFKAVRFVKSAPRTHHRYLRRIRKALQSKGYPSEWGTHWLRWKHPTFNANVVLYDEQDTDEYFRIAVIMLDSRPLTSHHYLLRGSTSFELVAKLLRHNLIVEI
jgi:hypothetical protein